MQTPTHPTRQGHHTEGVSSSSSGIFSAASLPPLPLNIPREAGTREAADGEEEKDLPRAWLRSAEGGLPSCRSRGATAQRPKVPRVTAQEDFPKPLGAGWGELAPQAPCSSRPVTRKGSRTVYQATVGLRVCRLPCSFTSKRTVPRSHGADCGHSFMASLRTTFFIRKGTNRAAPHPDRSTQPPTCSAGWKLIWSS